MRGAVVVSGLWGHEKIQCCIINVYASCLTDEKEELWDRLSSVISQNSGHCICIAGDFNAIRRISERAGRGITYNRRDIRNFDLFIRSSGMIDLPLHGRSYTWYRPNGSCKSRIDRILVNNEWLLRWPNSQQIGLRRSISDHCPLKLEIKVKDWGPKPFRSLNAWLVKEKWQSYNIQGWGSYVVKEKFKLLKGDLEIWNQQVFGKMEQDIESLRNELQQLDIMDDVFGLEEEENARR